MPVPTVEEQNRPERPDEADPVETLASRLERASHDPMAEGLGSGEAFERAVADAFVQMGFAARRIGGSGDSDVLVRWRDETGQKHVASVDAKSTSGSSIDHTHVSDVALASHAAKNGAEHIAIVAPGFAGKTLPEMARSRHWTLITADDLVELLRATCSLGVKPSELAHVFDGEDGPAAVHTLIGERRRQLGIISLIVKRLRTEAENDEALSPRDISLMERDSRIAPRIPELVTAMDLLSTAPISSIELVQDASEPKYVSFTIGDALASAMRLRALADAIETGWHSTQD